MGRPRKYKRLHDRNVEWKKRTDFEASDYRKGYKAGYNRARAGKPLTDISTKSEDYQRGYQIGFLAGTVSNASDR